MIYKTLKKVSEYCQLLDKRDFPATTTKDGITWTNNGDGTITADGTCTANYYSPYIVENSLRHKTVVGHKYILFAGNSLATGQPAEVVLMFYPRSNGKIFSVASVEQHIEGIVGWILPEGSYSSYSKVEMRIRSGFTVSNLVFKPQLFDLTEMYGSGNEPTTVEQFKADFPNELYDYKPYCFVKSYKTLLKATDDKIITSYKKSLVCKTKNLFPTSTAIGTLNGWSQATARQFEEDKWYIGISGTNYYIPSNIIEYELTGNYVYINTVGAGYGIGKAFKCEPNQTYTISCKWVEKTNYMQISIGFYDENGNYLSYNAAAILAERYTVTIPANCKWFTVCFVGNSSGSSYVYNIQLELGDTATEYHPYGYL